MPCSTKIKIGSSLLVTVTGADEEELFRQASFFGELPCKCGRCGGTDLAFNYRRTGGSNNYEYYSLKCKSCEATYACGQLSAGGLYARGNKETGEWDEKYVASDRGRDDRRSDSRRDDRDQRRESAPRYRRDDDRRRDDRDRGASQSTQAADEDDVPF